ncbi:MAG: acetylxylan esterase [Oscillospiraceae bacterium]|nr:acetylxylan esterase [Oscillospiraceae bacterium]
MSREFELFASVCDEYHRCSGNQLRDHIYTRQLKKLDEGDAVRAAISTREELEAYNRKVRRSFIDCLGGLPDMSLPLDAVVTDTVETDEFTMESILYRSTAHTYVPASLYIPKGITLPAPAVLFVCGHTMDGRLGYRYVQQTLVRAGLIVFTIDPAGQGERANFYNPETGEYDILRTVPDHDGCGIPATANGTFLERWFLCDQFRAVDYMLTRPEIDPARIGITGNSGGGLQSVSMMVADERLAAAAPGTYVTTRRDWLYTDCAMDSEQIWPGCDDFHFDHVSMLMAFAPKPVALITDRWDYFPIEGTRQTFEEAKRFYAMYGKEDNLRMYEDDCWHSYTKKLAVNAAEFFTEVFYGKPRTVTNEDLPYPETENRFAAKGGYVLGSVPDARSLPVLVREDAAKLREARLALPAAERLARAENWLRELVNAQRQPVSPNPRIFGPEQTQRAGGYVATRHSWWTQRRLFSEGLLIRKEELENTKGVPTVIAIWDDGTKKLAEHEDWIRAQCEAGRQVLVLEVPGVGANAQNRFSEWYPYKAGYGTLYKLCCDLIYMGDSMPAMNTWDVLRAIEMVEQFWGTAQQDITLYCDGEDGVFGVMAGFLNKTVRREYGESLLISVEETCLGAAVPEYGDYMRHIVPGMLKYFDYRELME